MEVTEADICMPTFLKHPVLKLIVVKKKKIRTFKIKSRHLGAPPKVDMLF